MAVQFGQSVPVEVPVLAALISDAVSEAASCGGASTSPVPLRALSSYLDRKTTRDVV
jgi:hypothetical protein